MGAEEFKSLQDKFRSMSGKTGTIDEEQFPKLLESLHIKTTKSEQSILFKEIDLDGDKRITFSEFLKGLKWIKTVCCLYFFAFFISFLLVQRYLTPKKNYK